jgi:hypothetical protein
MQLESFRDGPLQPGPVNDIKSRFFAGKQHQGLTAEILNHLPRLGQGKRPGADFHQGQIYYKAQISEPPVLFPNRLAPSHLIHVGHVVLPEKEQAQE